MRTQNGDLLCVDLDTGELQTFDYYRGPPEPFKVIDDVGYLGFINAIRKARGKEPVKELKGSNR